MILLAEEALSRRSGRDVLHQKRFENVGRPSLEMREKSELAQDSPVSGDFFATRSPKVKEAKDFIPCQTATFGRLCAGIFL